MKTAEELLKEIETSEELRNEEGEISDDEAEGAAGGFGFIPELWALQRTNPEYYEQIIGKKRESEGGVQE